MVSMKLEQFPSVREYVTSVMMVSQELQDLGKEVDDELLAALMLQGLTIEFQPMRLAIENSNVVPTM
ncbi:Retrovirus-related Pol polyprotein from transposon TNT 1-94 [Operophtera brumata]|uniref:Retrovirus-related Pol polyprotein from transposon TNT 1-94 n=1 Tax=Operophtera brumata TaxID=104452 RepID=A0A0L7L1V7_OPEBR|nr:Retrovirus-related Pol polyprotein from transposon TNT 1-94 [Operophtera brumata]